MSNIKFNIFKSSKVYIIFIHIILYKGSKEVPWVCGTIFLCPRSVKTYNKYSCRYHCKGMSKSPLLLFAEGKTSTKILPHTPPLKITFRLLCVHPERKRGFLPGNKSTKIKTKRIQQRIGKTVQNGPGPTRFYGRFSCSPLNGDVEKIILYFIVVITKIIKITRNKTNSRKCK